MKKLKINNNFYIKFNILLIIILVIFFILSISACNNNSLSSKTSIATEISKNSENSIFNPDEVIAVETFLADITQNITNGRINISALIPIGVDPHEFEPTPKDFNKISKAKIIIINGGGIEGWLEKALKNTASNAYIINASEGLGDPKNPDPHFWLDPNYVINYVQNISNGLIKEDPIGKDIYLKNSENYILKLQDLDKWIKNEVSILPIENRLIITNHESFNYFAKRYGFKIIGTIIPNVSSDAEVSAKHFADLVNKVKESKAKAIFLETGTNPALANQLASETGIKVVNNLYTHSLSDKNGVAPTYIDMMKFNTKTIVDNLK